VMLNVTVGAPQGTSTQLGCLPPYHSFTWASAIDPINQLVYGMGQYPKTASYRSLVTVNYTSGSILYNAPEGDANSGDNCPYFIATDPVTQNVYGLWNQVGFAQIDRITGLPTIYMNFSAPPAEGFCMAAVGFNTNVGYFDSFRGAYVTIWTCELHIFLARFYVETGKLALLPLFSSTITVVADLNVESRTGETYILTTNTVNTLFDVYLVGGTDENPKVVGISELSTSYEVFANVVALPMGACVYLPNLRGLGTPEFRCTLAFDAPWNSSFAGLNTDDLRYFDHGTLVRCPQ